MPGQDATATLVAPGEASPTAQIWYLILPQCTSATTTRITPVQKTEFQALTTFSDKGL